MSNMFSYIVASDSGFAPNIHGDICTLACCKPKIRMTARVGDWIIGTTPAPLSGRLTYAMRVGRGLTFDMYFDLIEYKHKKPSPENPQGDNIYKRGFSGELEQIPNNAHDISCLKHDTNTNRVLIADEFYYFGKESPLIPSQFQTLVHTTQGHKIIQGEDVQDFISWLRKQYAQGVHGQSTNNNVSCSVPDKDNMEAR